MREESDGRSSARQDRDEEKNASRSKRRSADWKEEDDFDWEDSYDEYESEKKESKRRKKSSDSQENPSSGSSRGRKSSGRSGSRKNGNADSDPDQKEKVHLRMDNPGNPTQKAAPYVLMGAGILLFLFLLLNLFCNFGNRLGGNPAAHWMGKGGYWICYTLFGLFGAAVFVLPVLVIGLALMWNRFRRAHNLAFKTVAALLFQILLSTVIHTIAYAAVGAENQDTFTKVKILMQEGAAMRGGGLIGGKCGQLFISLFNIAGGLAVVLVLLICTALYLFGVTPEYLIMRLRHRKELSGRKQTTLSEQEAERASRMAKKTAQEKKSFRESGKVSPEGYPEGAVKVWQSGKNQLVADDLDAPLMPNIQIDPNALYLPDGVRKVLREEAKKERVRVESTPAETVPAIPEKSEPEREKPPVTESVVPVTPNRTPARAALPDDPEARRRAELDRAQEEKRNREAIEAQRRKREMQGSSGAYGGLDPIFPQSDKLTKRVRKEDRAFDLMDVFSGDEDGTTAAGPAPAHAPVPPEKPVPEKRPTAANPAGSAKPGQVQSAPGGAHAKPEIYELKSNKTPPAADAGAGKASGPAVHAPEPPKPYVFPPMSCLQKEVAMTEQQQEEIEESTRLLESKFEEFNLKIKGIGYACGPTVTRYEITPEHGVHARQIMGMKDDIALAFGYKQLPMEQVPGKNAIGVEIPNRNRKTVYLRTLLEDPRFRNKKARLNVALGADVVNQPVYGDIVQMPHLLVGGTTNSGKSVCINSMVVSLLYCWRPDELQMLLIDPKQVEFAPYHDLPHLLAPVINSVDDAVGALQAAVEEMEKRYDQIAEVGAKTLETYNEKTKDDPDKPFMPYLVIIIDELADLMIQRQDQVEPPICRLLQKGRACGIHLILGTQRPSVDVVTGLVKANVPSRIACTTRSSIDSRTILDSVGAEKLLGRGDMLYSLVGSKDLLRVQGAFVSEDELDAICGFIRKKNGLAQYSEEFTSKMKSLSEQAARRDARVVDADAPEDGEDDPKYVDAVRVAMEEGRMSTSLLQRKLKIGYGRGAKLIDRMEAEGIVSPPDGSKPRTILISAEEFLRRFGD